MSRESLGLPNYFNIEFECFHDKILRRFCYVAFRGQFKNEGMIFDIGNLVVPDSLATF